MENKFKSGDKIKFGFEYRFGKGIIVKKFTKHQYFVKITESNSEDCPVNSISLFTEEILKKVE